MWQYGLIMTRNSAGKLKFFDETLLSIKPVDREGGRLNTYRYKKENEVYISQVNSFSQPWLQLKYTKGTIQGYY